MALSESYDVISETFPRSAVVVVVWAIFTNNLNELKTCYRREEEKSIKAQKRHKLKLLWVEEFAHEEASQGHEFFSFSHFSPDGT